MLLQERETSSFEQYDCYPNYFSTETFWTSEQLWEFIGVPFAVVSQAVTNVAQLFREKLKGGLRDLLPDAKTKPLAKRHRSR